MDKSDQNRLRTPPRERFEGDTNVFDMERIYEQLAEEPHEGVAGHRQIALFKSGTSTVVAFLFEEGGTLPEHRADGVVTIHVIEGRLQVDTPDERHAVGEDGLLVLRPGVPHEVRATEPSKMLLTVHLRKPESHRENGDARR